MKHLLVIFILCLIGCDSGGNNSSAITLGEEFLTEPSEVISAELCDEQLLAAHKQIDVCKLELAVCTDSLKNNNTKKVIECACDDLDCLCMGRQ